MITGKQVKHKSEARGALPAEVREARKHLRVTGWTYREAAEEIGVNFTHLALVLTAKRISARLLGRVLSLPARD
jgi:hypothetical protein